MTLHPQVVYLIPAETERVARQAFSTPTDGDVSALCSRVADGSDGIRGDIGGGDEGVAALCGRHKGYRLARAQGRADDYGHPPAD